MFFDGQLAKLAKEVLLQTVLEGKRVRKHRLSRQLATAQFAGQLHEREGVAPRLERDAFTGSPVDRPPYDRGQQFERGVAGQALYSPVRQARQRPVKVVADLGEDHRDGIRVEPSGDKTEHVGGR